MREGLKYKGERKRNERERELTQETAKVGEHANHNTQKQ